MVLTPDEAVAIVKDRLLPAFDQERTRLDRIDHWYRWSQEEIPIPRRATPELRKLRELSKTPWLHLVVTSAAQCLYVDSYRSPLDPPSIAPVDDEKPRGPWRTWMANDMPNRQIAIHRAALAYGYCFLKVLPGTDSAGEPTAVMRGVSPRKMYALYADPAEDDYPIFAIQVDGPPSARIIRLFDDQAVYNLSCDSSGGSNEVKFIDWREHDAGVCPIVRFCNQLDLDGRTPGEVEPFIPAAQRINKSAFDRLVTQHFASWKVRYVTGMAEPDSDAEKQAVKLTLRQEDLLVAEDPDTKFGTLDSTPLDGFISAWRADIEALAAASQTPTHELTGQLVNLSAEALAAARAALTQRVYERQQSFGRSHTQALKLAAYVEGNADYASDVNGRVTWQDMEVRSMSQAVDALGKAAQMLMVPPAALWGRIPGVEKSDVDEWRRLADEADPVARMRSELGGLAESPGDRVPVTPSDSLA